jgi:hypothetical protein
MDETRRRIARAPSYRGGDRSLVGTRARYGRFGRLTTGRLSERAVPVVPDPMISLELGDQRATQLHSTQCLAVLRDCLIKLDRAETMTTGSFAVDTVYRRANLDVFLSHPLKAIKYAVDVSLPAPCDRSALLVHVEEDGTPGGTPLQQGGIPVAHVSEDLACVFLERSTLCRIRCGLGLRDRARTADV